MMIDTNAPVILVKRDGREEPYTHDKLLKVVKWACNGDHDLAMQLIDALDIKINNRMPVSKLYDEVIDTAANMINPIQRVWDDVAKNLYLMKIYKESYNLKTTGYYPSYSQVVKSLVNSNIYSGEVYNSFTEEELDQLGDMIVPDRDLLFTFKGLYIENAKYCLKSSSGNYKELPQHSYLRIATYSFYREPDKAKRMELIKAEYDVWSQHDATAGTPRVLNSGTPRPQLASCVLSTMDDDTNNIMDTARNMALYSKFNGGLALDVSRIRSSGSKIVGNKGVSNGVVPFVQIIEKTVSGFNQGGTRSGAAVVTYPFWIKDVRALIALNDAGGAEDHRARKLKYTMKMHRILKTRARKNQKISLFNPVDVPLLLTTYGDEFTKNYEMYEKDNSISKTTISARSLMYDYAKSRKETGNTYFFLADNVNEQDVVGLGVDASNLCTEITVKSSPSSNYEEKIVVGEDGITKIVSEKIAGEIGLCNLFSVNLYNYHYATPERRNAMLRILLRGADNVIDYQFYPVKEGKLSNIRKRPIGIGVNNYANILADQKIRYTDEEAKKFTHELFEDLYFRIYSLSVELAKERGPFECFKSTRWAKGETPVSLSILRKITDRPDLNYPLLHDWDKLSEDIKVHGVRFSLHGAIAPTATSGKVISATESIEPPIEFFMMEEGTQTIPGLIPNLQNREFYQLAYSIPTKTIIELTAIRQVFIDQAQSWNTYERSPKSAKKMVQDIFYADDLGVKTGYYFKTPKADKVTDASADPNQPAVEVEDYVCESCT